jgi:aryl-alcohol dehydrogenase-like predicted oxidoreductase
MQYSQLGESDLKVSRICLGTATYGLQNTIDDAHHQLDYAFAHGINYIDTAEKYPTPSSAQTYGLAETYVGEWLKHQQRDQLIISTKIAGPGRGTDWLRDGNTAINRDNIQQAVDGSLKRLQTDYIDLYQIHWPDRYVPFFGETIYDPTRERATVPIAEQLSALNDLVQAGKIRYIGLCNETAWGVCEFSHVAQQLGLPKITSVQNPYNLLNRIVDVALAEVCYREKVGVLAYSPLAYGLLTGKYLNNQPEDARITLFEGFKKRFHKPNVNEAVAAYAEIAHQYNLTSTKLALAFVLSRWFVNSMLIGATKLNQLQENLASLDVVLDEEILAKIDAVHTYYPNPAP